jgi:hypothetical protein
MTTGSIVICGDEPWPPTPKKVMSSWSVPAIRTPGELATTPTGPGAVWVPNA